MRLSIFVAIKCIFLQIMYCQGGTPLNRLNFFDTELLRYTAEGKKGNVMISPASIKSTLGMLLEGAKGPTAKEIKIALRVSPVKDDYREEIKVFAKVFEANNTLVSLQNANALFISKKLNLNKQYESVVQRLYLAEITKVNFSDPKSSADTVNHWVDKKTHGLIPAIVDEDQITPATEMMITNALYFKAPWKHGFHKRATYSDCFYNNGVCKNVSMMILQAELNYAYVESLRAHALELPYQDTRYSMILVVPQDQNAEISQLRDLPFVGLPHIADLMEPVDIVLTMPKFDVEYTDDMVGPLKNMQIKTLFSQSANLSGIFGAGEYAHLNSIYHSVHMKVDEVGTIAAAASSSVVVPLINDQVQLQINRPFLFFIRDNKLGVILFEGKIEEPTEFVETNSSQGLPKEPQQITKQPLANYNNSQHQTSSQAFYSEIPKYYTMKQTNRTNFTQGTLNQPSSYQGGFNKRVVQINQQGLNHAIGHQGQSQSDAGRFLSGQPQTNKQRLPNQLNLNPETQQYSKVSITGSNNPARKSSSDQEGLARVNQQFINDANGRRLYSQSSSSSFSSYPTLGRTDERQPTNGAFLGRGYRGHSSYDYPLDY